MDGTLAPRGSPLREALDAFRSSPGWPDHLDDVPPLDVDFGTVRGRLDQLRGFVDQVAFGFEAADRDPADAVVIADDRVLVPFVSIALDETIELVQDGDRWIFPGTSGDDFVRVVTRDGQTYLEVAVVYEEDGRRRLRWESRRLTDAQAADLVLRTGGGNDWVAVSPDVHVGITVWTGDGNDVYGSPGEHYSSRLGGSGDDRIFTGAGDDRVDAGAGDDQVYTGAGGDYVDGQDGNDTLVPGRDADVVYGGRGDDTISTGAGDDYADGGSGRDELHGGDGTDTLSGGRGDDVLYGGAGDDNLFGGRDVGTVVGGDGDDKITGETHDRARGGETYVTIELTGDPGSYAIDLRRPGWMTDAEWVAWTERLDSDLELLRTTETGRRSLDALDRASRDSDNAVNPFDSDTRICIVPYAPLSEGNLFGLGRSPEAASFDEYLEAYLNHDRLPGEDDGDPVVDDLTRFDRSYAFDEWIGYGQANVVGGDYGAPVVTLQHELSHAWDHLHNGMIDIGGRTYTETRHFPDGRTEDRVAPRPELNSVGLDIDGDGDIDTVGAGDGTDHPTYLTENALRDELRMRRRTSYEWGTFEGDDPITYGDSDD
ncbi:MAG: M91 family zinc metallopeptidase [Acidimicrobiales bacterium]